MRIYDAGAGAFQDAGFGSDIWFAAVGFVFAEEVDGYVYAFGEVVDFLEGVHLCGVLGDDPFSCVAVRDVVLFA